MPPPPEIGNTAGDIGIIKVLKELKAQHLSETYSHIGISGKVEIQLEGIEDYSQPRAENRPFILRKSGEGVPHCSCGIGKEHLFRETGNKGPETGGKEADAVFSFSELIVNVLVSDYRTCYQLWEESYVCAEGCKTFLYPRVSPVYVDNVGQGLEGIKGYADG